MFKLLSPQDGLAPDTTGLEGLNGNAYTVIVISFDAAVVDVTQLTEVVITQLITSPFASVVVV